MQLVTLRVFGTLLREKRGLLFFPFSSLYPSLAPSGEPGCQVLRKLVARGGYRGCKRGSWMHGLGRIDRHQIQPQARGENAKRLPQAEAFTHAQVMTGPSPTVLAELGRAPAVDGSGRGVEVSSIDENCGAATGELVEQSRTWAVSHQDPGNLKRDPLGQPLGHPPAHLVVPEGRTQADYSYRLKFRRRKCVAHEMQGS